MTHRLHGEEHAVQHDRHEDQVARLQRRERRTERRHGEARHDEAEHCERQDDRKERVRALQVVGLLVITQPSEQQRQADHPVQHDHHDGEHCIPGERHVALAGVHHGGDQHDLDAGHRECQDQRAIRLAELRGQHLGVPHDRERRSHHHREQPAP
jgi:hypothetical protein